MNAYYDLMKSWCDRLIEMQITEIKDPAFYGGILCPACAMIHGRMADSVYPFTLLYDTTGDEKYLLAAKRAIAWAEYNVRRQDGSYFNDKCNGWKGTTVFFHIALGEALFYHSDCLDAETLADWRALFRRTSEFLYRYFDIHGKTNVNYYVCVCPAMALSYRILGDEKYKQKAYERYAFSKTHITPEGFLSGEGPFGKEPDKGCYYVDLGYNLEESLPGLAVFAHLMEDEEAKAFVTETVLTHLEFILPDGGMDNSWGTRANKWTYWGSRTADGMAAGLCYLADRAPQIGEAIERNFHLMERCSKTGDLYGGPMCLDNGEEACSHHSFSHAKGLATLIDSGFCYRKAELPRDTAYGSKHFDDIHADLLSTESFLATFTDNAAVTYRGTDVSGGTLAFLYHRRYGAILAASAENYNDAMNEPRNMQLSRTRDHIRCSALRITSGKFSSLFEKAAAVQCKTENETFFYHTKGVLKDTDGHPAFGYSLSYTIDGNTVTVTASAEQDAELFVPLIASKKDSVQVSNGCLLITKGENRLTLEPQNTSLFRYPDDLLRRDFNPIGGFCFVTARVGLIKKQPVTFRILL